jgi:hypothetical protein
MIRMPGDLPATLDATSAQVANDNASDDAPERDIASESNDDRGTGERVILSRKEHARFLRQQAYRKAKERRAKDPKYLALKEAAKAHRRELYQRVKAQRKAAEADTKGKRTLKRVEERAEAGRALVRAVRGLSGKSE